VVLLPLSFIRIYITVCKGSDDTKEGALGFIENEAFYPAPVPGEGDPAQVCSILNYLFGLLLCISDSIDSFFFFLCIWVYNFLPFFVSSKVIVNENPVDHAIYRDNLDEVDVGNPDLDPMYAADDGEGAPVADEEQASDEGQLEGDGHADHGEPVDVGGKEAHEDDEDHGEPVDVGGKEAHEDDEEEVRLCTCVYYNAWACALVLFKILRVVGEIGRWFE
jgi:hypothetical protein